METSKDTIIWLLNIANDMRKAKGDPELDDIPRSVPRDIDSCIIANAFNYGCEVHPSTIQNPDGTYGYIIFEREEDRDTYLDLMAIDLDSEYHENGVYSWAAPLTPELNDIAIKFDRGVLFKEYYKIGIDVGEILDCYPEWENIKAEHGWDFHF